MEVIYIFYALIVSFLLGILAIFQKIFLKRIDYITFMCISGLMYCFMLICYILYYKSQFFSDIKKIKLITYFWIFISILFGLFIINILFFYLLKHNEPSVVVAITFSAPLFTLLGAYFLLEEKIHTYGVLGVLFIVFGIILISMNKE